MTIARGRSYQYNRIVTAMASAIADVDVDRL